MENKTKTVVSYFKSESEENLPRAVTRKWAELINQVEKSKKTTHCSK